MTRSTLLPLAILAPLVGSTAAAAEDPAETPFTLETPWTVRIEPVLWYPGLRGDISFAGGGDSEDNAFEVEDIDLDENEIAPAVRAEIRWDRWFVRASGFTFNADDTGRAGKAVDAGALAIPRGTLVDFDLSYSSFEISAGHRLWDRTLGAGGDDQVGFSFDLYGGLRYYEVDLDLETAGGSVSGDGSWIEPMIGIRLGLEITRDFSIDLNSDFGFWDSGDDASSSWNIEAGFRWELHENVDVRLGFRHLSTDLSEGSGSDEFIFDNALAGLALSVGIRF